MNHNIYPLLLQPIYKNYIWGGNRIKSIFKRENTPEPCAESWEVADRPEGMSIVMNGPLKGQTLHDLVETMGKVLTGHKCNTFPLLIKIIDAKNDLSVQVHPDEKTAPLTGGEPKTEMWHILSAEPGAKIYAGLKPGVTHEKFEKALAEKRMKDDILAAVPATPGRTIFVPGGQVHAIGAGSLLLEIQQNSNTTYRVYDWDRLGADGKPRPLHLKEALQVINWENAAPHILPPKPLETTAPNRRMLIAQSPFFLVERLELREVLETAHDGKSFQIIFTVSGNLLIGANGLMASAPAGTSCLLPAAATDYTLTPLNGTAAAIRISQP